MAHSTGRRGSERIRWSSCSVVVVLLAFAVACDSPNTQCGPESCTGCCDDGVCIEITGDAQCGSAGLACTSCEAERACVEGRCVRMLPDASDAHAGPADGGAVWDSDGGIDAGAGPGDECSSAILILEDAGSVQLMVNARDAGDDTQGSCSLPGANEQVFEFSVTEVSDLHWGPNLFNASDEVRGYLRSASCEAGPELGCWVTTFGSSGPPILTVLPGTYFLFVEPTVVRSNASGDGVFVQLKPRDEGDTCANPVGLQIPPDGGSVSFSMNGVYRNDDAPTCTPGYQQQDKVFRFSLEREMDIAVSAASADGVHTHLFLRRGNCDAGEEVACLGPSFNSAPTLEILDAVAGDYFLFVESGNGTTPSISGVLTAVAPPLPPVNDECTGALPLVFDGGVASLSMDLEAATASRVPSCGGDAGTPGDAVFTYTLTTAADVTVLVDSTDGGFVHVASVQPMSDCGSAAAELSCRHGDGLTVQHLGNQQPGSYALWVDGLSRRHGRVDLQVVASAPTPKPQHDDCATAQPLTFEDGVAVTTGTLISATNGNSTADPAPACGGAGPRAQGRDVVFTYELETTENVFVELTAKDPNLDPPIAYVRRLASCHSGAASDEIGCAAPGPARQSELFLANQPPGAYAVFVDELPQNGADLDFELRVSRHPVWTNETCASAAPATFDDAGVYRASGHLAFAADDLPTCGGGQNELVWRLSLAGTREVRVSSPNTAIALTEPCDAGSACVGCGVLDEVLPAGDYDLIVSGSGGLDFNLEVGTRIPLPPAPNASCAGALPLFADGGVADQIVADLRGARPSFDCGPRELWYSFSTSAPATLVVDGVIGVDVDRAVWDELSLRPAYCSPNGAHQPVAIAFPLGGGRARMIAEDLPAGAWELKVATTQDLDWGSPVNLDVRVEPPWPPPVNDTCAAATPLVFTNGFAEAIGSTKGASADTDPVAGAACGPVSGRDVVYRIEVPPGPASSYSLRSLVEPLNRMTSAPYQYVRDACGGTGGAQQSCSNSLLMVTDGLTAGSTYYLFVDEAHASMGGPFWLHAELAPMPPPNEDCATALPIFANASIASSTLGAQNDVDGHDYAPCGSGGGGPDVVYRFDAQVTAPVTVKVSPTIGYNVRVGLLSSCAAGACLALADDFQFAAGNEQLTVSATQGETYFIVVDAADEYGALGRGGFILEVAQ